MPVAALVGCGAIPPARILPPRIRFGDLSLEDVSAQRLRFALTVRAENPNDLELPLSNLKANLQLLGLPFADGRARESRFTLPPTASRDVTLDFDLPLGRMPDLLRALRAAPTGAIAYRVTGSTLWGDTDREIPFERSGTLDSARLLRDALGRALGRPGTGGSTSEPGARREGI